MPPKKCGKNNFARGLGDVTLNDFANSSVPKNRPKKSSNNVNVVLKEEVEKSWDEKDEEEFEGEFVAQENEDGTVSYVIQKVEPRVRKKTASTSDKSSESGYNYPIDIWFLLSEYIRPEDVGTFALICKTSFEVVCTARFWFGLYRRYYKSVLNMPEPLQPEGLIRRYGLRANVVRALYHMYQPFVNRIKPITTFEEHPDSLMKYECYVLWYTMKNTNYIYYFKMKQKILNTLPHSRDKLPGPDLLVILDDVSANPDEHCRILEVSCLHFNNVPPVIGFTLTSVSLTLSSAPKYRYHRLQLVFGSGITSSSNVKVGADITTVILDPVINIRVLDWWHPLYPHRNNMGELINLQEK